MEKCKKIIFPTWQEFLANKSAIKGKFGKYVIFTYTIFEAQNFLISALYLDNKMLGSMKYEKSQKGYLNAQEFIHNKRTEIANDIMFR